MSRRRNRLSNEDVSSDEDQSSVTSESSDDEVSDQQRDLTNDEMEKVIQLSDLTGKLVNFICITKTLKENSQNHCLDF